ncbi:MAG: GDSL-type esterase/lipase family protein [Thiotrichaceae bacterium]
MSRIKSILKILLINGLFLLALLYIFEFFFSPFSDMPKNGIMLTGEEYTWGHKVRRNQLGYRERDFTNPKPDDVFRVIVLGDSLTMGMGLAESERYTHLTEKRLRKQFPERKIEILNFGMSGYPTVTERDDLLKHYEFVKPDLIVIGFCINDTQPKEQNWSIEQDKYYHSFMGKLITVSKKVMRRLGLNYIAKLTHQLYYQPLINVGKIPEWQTALQRTYEPESKEWQDFTQALQDIKNLSEKLQLPTPVFSVLNQGTYTDKPTYYSNPDKNLQQFLKWYEQAEHAAKKVGLNTYNHQQEIIEHVDDEILAVNKFDGHPSASLNRIYSDKLADVLTKIINTQSLR